MVRQAHHERLSEQHWVLSSLLFSDYRRRVLGLLLLNPDTTYHVRELARLTGTSAGTLHKELTKLTTLKALLLKLCDD